MQEGAHIQAKEAWICAVYVPCSLMYTDGVCDNR